MKFYGSLDNRLMEGRNKMKKFKCWYLSDYGWICFEKEFKNEKEALAYCESKTDYKGSSIVECGN